MSDIEYRPTTAASIMGNTVGMNQSDTPPSEWPQLTDPPSEQASNVVAVHVDGDPGHRIIIDRATKPAEQVEWDQLRADIDAIRTNYITAARNFTAAMDIALARLDRLTGYDPDKETR